MKRFYCQATAVEGAEGWHIALDGRQVKTQGGSQLVLPSARVAQLLAGEWSAQGDEIDPLGFPLRDLADYALDVVARDRAAAVDALLRYADTDTLCYRADPDEALWRRQQDVWEPLLAKFEAREGIALQRVSGVIHRAQNPAALATLRARLATLDDLTLAALTTLASLSASLVIGLAALEADAYCDALWEAAHLEEEWQADKWGRDAGACALLDVRKRDFVSAMAFAAALR